jgi:hypothetical protein
MPYVKHPEHGNKHVSAEEAKKLVSEGWVSWPRSREEKEGRVKPAIPQPTLETFVVTAAGEVAETTDETAPEQPRSRNTLSLKR